MTQSSAAVFVIARVSWLVALRVSVTAISWAKSVTLTELDPEDVAVVVLFPGKGTVGPDAKSVIAGVAIRYYEYALPVGAVQMRVLLNAQPVARWTRHGQ